MLAWAKGKRQENLAELHAQSSNARSSFIMQMVFFIGTGGGGTIDLKQPVWLEEALRPGSEEQWEAPLVMVAGRSRVFLCVEGWRAVRLSSRLADGFLLLAKDWDKT